MPKFVLQDHDSRDKPRDGCLPNRVSAWHSYQNLLQMHMLLFTAAPHHEAKSRRTILELVRDMASDLVADGARVKVCVQQALGQGVFQVWAPIYTHIPPVSIVQQTLTEAHWQKSSCCGMCKAGLCQQ